MTTDLQKRSKITQSAIKRWYGVAFRWGKADCWSLAASHLAAMGHSAALPDVRFYRNALGAQRELVRHGVARLPEYLDKIETIKRLPSPAFALPGDLAALPAEDNLGAIVIYLGNGTCLGWHPDADGCQIQNEITQWEAAWRL